MAGSILLQPFIRSASNLLKGSGQWGVLSWFRRTRVSAQGRRQERIEAEMVKLKREDPTSSARARADLAAELRQLPPARSLRPTMLGNLISRAEEDAGARYGFDTRVAIPRLDPLLRESVRAALNTARDELNFSVRLTITSMLATISSAVVLHRHGWWLLVPAAALTSAWLCYKNSIAAAAKYGEELHVAFDLDRFKLYEESHLGTPQNRDEELKLAQQLTEFWTYGRGDGDGVG